MMLQGIAWSWYDWYGHEHVGHQGLQLNRSTMMSCSKSFEKAFGCLLQVVSVAIIHSSVLVARSCQ